MIMDKSNSEKNKVFSLSMSLKQYVEVFEWLKSWIMENFYVVFMNDLEQTDFKEAVTNFYQEIQRRLLHVYLQHQHKNNDIYLAMLSACQLVLFESLSSFEDLFLNVPFCVDRHYNLILCSCVLLNKKHRLFLKWMTPKLNNITLHAKCTILKQFFTKQLIDHAASLKELKCVLHLVEELGDLMLVEQTQFAIESLKTNCSISLPALTELHKKQMQQSLPDIVADGRICDRNRDPPGQRSVYIPPGDPFKEAYRLSTFLKFPEVAPVNPSLLAKAGFLYTGYKDRVKCFSCGSSVDSWCADDDVQAASWHRSDCLMAKGKDNTNVPLGLGLFSKRSTVVRRPNPSIQSANVEPNDVPERRVSEILTPVQPTSYSSMPAGAVLMGTTGTWYSQTARPISSRQNPNVAIATITSAHHENLVKNLDLRKEAERLKTYDNWPREYLTIHPGDLARSGFFYLGNVDRVQCFSCGGVLRNWRRGDDVDEEHRRHFSNCRMVDATETRNIPLPINERPAPPPARTRPVPHQEPPKTSESEMIELRNIFPCLYPVNPHMRSEESRFETFDQRWLRSRVNATPRQIARAGFFFLGERDRVKCWYCNGGLQNWDKEDEPWSEHAKWFPSCEFLLQHKGTDFVHRMVSLYPNIHRPVLRSPYDVPPGQSQNRYQVNQRECSPPPTIVDPQEEMKRIRAEMKKAMKSALVRSAQEMSFETPQIRRVIKRKLRNGGSMFTSVSELVDALTIEAEPSESDDDDSDPEGEHSIAATAEKRLDIPYNLSEPSTSHQPACQKGGENSRPSSAESHLTSISMQGSTLSMEERIRELQDERKCKICLDKPADIVFVPCGHLCCCRSCAEAVRRCPICRAKIEKGLRAYIS